MRFHQRGHAVAAEVHLRLLARIHCRTEAFLIVAAINPARRQAKFVCGLVIMKQALGGMQDLFFLDPTLAKLVD